VPQWASAHRGDYQLSWATATPSSIAPVRWNSRTTCSRASAVDAAVVVCEADERKLPAIADHPARTGRPDIPRFLFLNKSRFRASKRIRETLGPPAASSRIRWCAAIHAGTASDRGLRRSGAWSAPGCLSRATRLRSHALKEAISTERKARFSYAEKGSRSRRTPMGGNCSRGDIAPRRATVFDDLAREMQRGLICPCNYWLGLARKRPLRLMKALRHESALCWLRDRRPSPSCVTANKGCAWPM